MSNPLSRSCKVDTELQKIKLCFILFRDVLAAVALECSRTLYDMYRGKLRSVLLYIFGKCATNTEKHRKTMLFELHTCYHLGYRLLGQGYDGLFSFWCVLAWFVVQILITGMLSVQCMYLAYPAILGV